ncbi:MAG: hypothetical protein SOW08_06730 [Lachnospiraceae bacterium]|nr:hypothetical protein [Lachnospiraceae bacterium]
MLEDLFVSIVNCRTLPEILDDICGLLPRHLTLAQSCDLWVNVSSLMMDLELPMLKGRSRQDFERETGLSAWQTGMLPETIAAANTKDRRMCEFPA